MAQTVGDGGPARAQARPMNRVSGPKSGGKAKPPMVAKAPIRHPGQPSAPKPLSKASAPKPLSKRGK